MDLDDFKELIQQKGQELYRDMPWRSDTRPYYILVSELMLQQTQVDRVIPKFEQFISRFPDENALANSLLSEVIKQWQGLGYNRRAKFLHQAVQKVAFELNGRFPNTQTDLIGLPGVGINTAGAIAAYAYNQPALFIETNIRTVYIHHFYHDEFDISDKQIINLLSKTINQRNPRTFYWAMMDYGSNLKKSGIKNNHKGKHYKKQSPLKGSLREARGIILKELTQTAMDMHDFRRTVAIDDRFDVALEGLIKDGLVIKDEEIIKLAN